jgi:large subunit ribosomal protein L29
MKVNDLRQLSDNDLLSRLNDNKENLQKYRFQKSIQQLEDNRLLSDLRKENAKIKTVLREKILNKDNSNG